LEKLNKVVFLIFLNSRDETRECIILKKRMEYNGCVEIAEPDALTEKLNSCKSLPIHPSDARKLLDYHSPLSIMSFYERNRSVLEENKLMIRYPHNGSALIKAGEHILIEGTNWEKKLFQIDDSLEYYFFFNESDIAMMHCISQERKTAYFSKYGRCMIRLIEPPCHAYSSSSSSGIQLKRKATEELDKDITKAMKKVRFADELAVVVGEGEEENAKGRSTDLVIREKDEKITAIAVELALAKQEKIHNDEKHQYEMTIMRQQYERALQDKEIELLRIQQQQMLHGFANARGQSILMPSKTNPMNIKRPKTLSHWLSNTMYPDQDFSRVMLPKSAKWLGIADNMTFMNYCLSQLGIRFDAQQIPSLDVPMTYYYPMHSILNFFLVVNDRNAIYFSSQELHQLISRCPAQYRVMLLENRWDNEESLRINAANINTILFHCHVILVAHDVNNKTPSDDTKEKDNAKVCLFVPQPNELHPSIDIYGDYYPLSTFYGPYTFVSYGLGLRIRNATPLPKKVTKKKNRSGGGGRRGEEEEQQQQGRKKKTNKNEKKSEEKTGYGIGSGKCCPFCLSRERIFIPTSPTEPQFTHQLKSCPVLASLSNNEAVIIIALMDALKSTPGNEERAKRLTKNYLFSKPFQFNDMTLFREATEGEILNGEHVGGVRLNRAIYHSRTRLKASLNMETQLKRSDLFGPPHYAMKHLMNTLLVPMIGAIAPTFRMSSLLMSNDLKPFPMKPRVPEKEVDPLYFSFEPDLCGEHTNNYVKRWYQILDQQKGLSENLIGSM
jgi:hypothetical protein